MAQSIDTVSAVLEIVKIFDGLDLGDATCLPLLGPNDCRSMGRCHEGQGYVRAVQQLKTPSAINNFEAWMGRSSMNENCGHALLGGNISRLNSLYSALVDNVQKCCNGNWKLADTNVTDRRSGPGGGPQGKNASSAVVLESSPGGSGTNWSIINNGSSSKIQNLGNSKFQSWYLDIGSN